jgi:hypothetical protein
MLKAYEEKRLAERKADQERRETEWKAYEEKRLAERKADQERRETERKVYEKMMAERKADQEKREAERNLQIYRKWWNKLWTPTRWRQTPG